MKPRLLLSLLLIFISVCGHSQYRGYLAVSLGPSFPTSDFQNQDIDSDNAGIATIGATIDVSIAQKLGDIFGVTAMFRGKTNSTNNKPLLNELYNQNSNATWIVNGDNWDLSGLLFGVLASFENKSGQTNFETKAMIGYMDTYSPELNISGTQSNNSAWLIRNKTYSNAVAYLLGVGIKFEISHNLCILSNIDYSHTTPEFVDVFTETSSGNSYLETFKQKIDTFNFLIGIGLKW